MRRLKKPKDIDKIIVPGKFKGNINKLTKYFDIPVERGPEDLTDLPDYFGLKSAEKDLTDYECDIFAEIVDAVGDKIDVICEGGIQRGTHVLKALAAGAKACSGGRLYLYALAGAGQSGVERALGNLRAEIERDMKLMGCKSVSELNRSHLRFRRS